jgi:hypothetical protein
MSAPFTHDHYRDILRTAHKAGYKFARFGDLEVLQAGTERACFLRHDCDNDLVAAQATARIEAKMAVQSTWFVMMRSAMYNLMAPTNRSLVHQILELGHDLGLHFDAADVPHGRLRHELDRERRWLEDEFQTPVNVVSFHQPSAEILAGTCDLGVLNTYDRQAFDGVFYYSDSNMTFRDGCPSKLFRDGKHRLVQLLLHPEWWTQDAEDVHAKWARMLANNVALAQRNLLERELTYTRAHRLKIEMT